MWFGLIWFLVRVSVPVYAAWRDDANQDDLEADPEEKSPITRGEKFDAMAKRYRDFAKTVHEVAPTSCNVGCLNRAYANKP